MAGAEHEASGHPTTVIHLITTLSQGGAERVLSQVVPRPAEHPGERHVVVSLVAGGMFCDELVAAGVEVRDLGMRPGRDVVRGTLRLARMLRELRPDLVISWMYHASLLDMLARPFAAGAGRARMVWLLRGSLHSTTGLPLHTRMAIRVLAAFSGRPEAIAINSRSGRSHHVRAGYHPRRWIVLPNGCDTARFRPDVEDRAAVRAELGIGADAIVAITIAQLPLGVSMMKTSILQIGVELEHASQVCGAARARTFRRIVLPLMKPMLVSMFVLVAIAAIRDVSTVLLISQPRSLPLSVLMLEYANNGNTEPAAVVGIVTAAMVIAIAVVARRFGLQIGRPR